MVDDQLTKNSSSGWFCLHCSNNIFPFTNIANRKLQSVFNSEEYHVDDYIDNSINTCLALKPQENLANLFNEFNNLSSNQNNNSENMINCKYHDIDEIQSLNKLNNKCTLSLFHINSCFFSKNIEDLEYLLKSTSINFDVIAISETRIVKGKTPVNSLNLMNYSYEFCPTESSAGGTLLYIRNHLSYKPQHDPCIYKAIERSNHLLRFLILKDLT